MGTAVTMTFITIRPSITGFTMTPAQDIGKRRKGGILGCHHLFSGGVGNVFMSYHGGRGGWAFSGHEPKTRRPIIAHRYMEMYDSSPGTAIDDAPYKAWYSRRNNSKHYKAMINVGGVGGSAAVRNAILKYCRAATGAKVNGIPTGVMGVYAGNGELTRQGYPIHKRRSRAAVVYAALDTCTGGSSRP